MTRKQELLKKIPQIERGKNVRPPKEWWDNMVKVVAKDPKYSRMSDKRQSQITAGIWQNYSKVAKVGIVNAIVKEISPSEKAHSEMKDTPHNPILSGEGKGKPDSFFDKNELTMGIEHELEHTKDRNIAKIIAKDHLVEISDYYTRLNKMEKQAKKERIIIGCLI